MPVTATHFYRGVLGTSNATLYTTTGLTVVTSIVIANTSGVTATATLSLDGVVLVPTTAIAAYTNLVLDVRQVLAATKTITGFAGTASAVTCHLAGVVIT